CVPRTKAADPDERRVEAVCEDDREVAERGFGARDDRHGLGIPRGGGRVYARRILTAERPGKKSPADERLDAAVAAAPAARSLKCDRQMTDLTGDVRHTAKQSS